MTSRHYGNQVWLVHVWGERDWQHTWTLYGSEVQAKVQATRMAEIYYVEYGVKTARYEILPMTGSSG